MGKYHIRNRKGNLNIWEISQRISLNDLIYAVAKVFSDILGISQMNLVRKKETKSGWEMRLE